MQRLSIIVPVYNVENYLAKCLDSLLSQDIPFSEYEILIVNDGSTDKSYGIAQAYTKKNPVIRLISQENRGLGAARNKGIQESNGRYLFFVDSDDFIQENSLKQLLECMENENLEMLRFNYQAVNDKGEIIPKRNNSKKSIVYNEKVVDGLTFLSEHLGWGCYAWIFLIKAAFIKNNHLFFDEKIYFEDVEWLVRTLKTVKRVMSLDKQVYRYLERDGSITHGSTVDKKNRIISDKLQNINMLREFSRAAENSKVHLWCEGMISVMFMGILAFVANELPERKNEIVKMMYVRRFLPLRSYKFTFKQKRDMCIINLSPSIYCYLKKRSK